MTGEAYLLCVPVSKGGPRLADGNAPRVVPDVDDVANPIECVAPCRHGRRPPRAHVLVRRERERRIRLLLRLGYAEYECGLIGAPEPS